MGAGTGAGPAAGPETPAGRLEEGGGGGDGASRGGTTGRWGAGGGAGGAVKKEVQRSALPWIQEAALAGLPQIEVVLERQDRVS